ncbi:MAG: aldose epimerase family protein [Runella sp.]
MMTYLASAQASIEKTPFGQLPDGRAVTLFTLRNEQGMEARITDFGGYVVALTAPDRKGDFAPVVLGFATPEEYLLGHSFGPIIGRFANRIGGAKFTLNGQTYTLAANNGPNHIHGGRVGFNRKLWEATPIDGQEPALKLRYTSPDGEEGYPGQLEVEVTYTLQKNNALRIDYQAITNKPTVVNLTNHSYFNLNGLKENVLNHEVMLPADHFLPTDLGQIPTGELRTVAETPFDFRKPKRIGEHINDFTDAQINTAKGYDHCWVFSDQSKDLKKGAEVYEPQSGRLLTLYTTEPGVQFFTANHLNGKQKGATGAAFEKHFGFCLETQHFPDAPNQPHFPSTTLLPGQTYRSTTVYAFSVR